MTAAVPKLRLSHYGREKLCTRCNEWWPADREFFYAHPSGSAGLFYCCKACYHDMDNRPGRKPAPTGPQFDWNALATAIASPGALCATTIVTSQQETWTQATRPAMAKMSELQVSP